MRREAVDVAPWRTRLSHDPHAVPACRGTVSGGSRAFGVSSRLLTPGRYHLEVSRPTQRRSRRLQAPHAGPP